jgi:hypothetical protein
MDLDHVRGTKKLALSMAVQRAYAITLADVRAEIAKCEVVCANCHRLRTEPTYGAATRRRSADAAVAKLARERVA